MLKRFGKVFAATMLALVAALGVSGALSFAVDEPVKPADSMTLSPVSSHQELKPGQQFDGQFTIKNTGLQAFDFRVYAKPFSVGADCVDQYESETESSLIARWVSFDETDFYDLQPEASATVNFHIDVPEDAPGGGQYVVLFAETGNFDPANTTIGVNKRVGYKFYADLGGVNREAGEVKSVAQNQFYLEPPINSLGKVYNSGNLDFQSTHTYIVENFFGGEERHRVEQTVNVLPSTCRAVTSEWKDTPTFGLFKVTNQISFLGQNQFKETKWVLVVPIWFILIFALVVILLIWALILAVKKRGKRRLKKHPSIR